MSLLPVALTMGEPAGIGGELTLKAWRKLHDDPGACFFTLDDPARLKALSPEQPLKVIEHPAQASAVFADALPVLPVSLPQTVTPGQLDGSNAPAVTSAIEQAVSFAMAGDAAGVVTNPIHKKVLQDAGFAFPGHTEYLAHLAGIDSPPVMMLASDEMRVVPVTIHLALRDAIAQLTADKIVETGEIVATDLRKYFGIPDPRLAIAGLNPHAGEGGAMGHEDIDIVAPAVERLRAMGITASGPLPPDTMFHAAARKTYDAALCMYHDQALIPIKTIAFDTGVNVTLGLPFVRTSPDHGTALDIAGTGQADETSLISALRMARKMAAGLTL